VIEKKEGPFGPVPFERREQVTAALRRFEELGGDRLTLENVFEKSSPLQFIPGRIDGLDSKIILKIRGRFIIDLIPIHRKSLPMLNGKWSTMDRKNLSLML